MKNIYVLGGYSRHLGGRWSDSQSLNSVECYNSFTQVLHTYSVGLMYTNREIQATL